MSWLRRVVAALTPPPAGADDDALPSLAEEPFVCSTCGRTDLPPAGDWDPPICQECDAAINCYALQEE